MFVLHRVLRIVEIITMLNFFASLFTDFVSGLLISIQNKFNWSHLRVMCFLQKVLLVQNECVLYEGICKDWNLGNNFFSEENFKNYFSSRGNV